MHLPIIDCICHDTTIGKFQLEKGPTIQLCSTAWCSVGQRGEFNAIWNFNIYV